MSTNQSCKPLLTLDEKLKIPSAAEEWGSGAGVGLAGNRLGLQQSWMDLEVGGIPMDSGGSPPLRGFRSLYWYLDSIHLSFNDLIFL